MSLTHAAVLGLLTFALTMVVGIALSLIPLWVPAIASAVGGFALVVYKGWFERPTPQVIR